MAKKKLAEYRAKRDFAKTAESSGAKYYADNGSVNYHPRRNWVQADRKCSIVFRALF